jgi:hypothetical protein
MRFLPNLRFPELNFMLAWPQPAIAGVSGQRDSILSHDIKRDKVRIGHGHPEPSCDRGFSEKADKN